MHRYHTTCPWSFPGLVLVLALCAGCQKTGRTAADRVYSPERYGSSVAYEYALRGELYAEQGNLKAAVTAIEKALSSDPEDHYLRIRLATLLIETGKLAKARQHIEKVLKENPADGAAWLALAGYHEADGDDATSQASARRAMKVEPNNPAPRLWLAEHYLKRGRSQRAKEILEKALLTIPTNVPARKTLIPLLIGLGQKETAIHHIQSLPPISPDNQSETLERACFYAAADAPYKAREIIVSFFGPEPIDEAARLALVKIERLIATEKDSANTQFLPCDQLP